MTRFLAKPPLSNFLLLGVCLRRIAPVCTASQSHKPAHHDLSRFPAIHMLYGYNLIPFPCSNWELFFAGLPYPSQVLPLSPCIAHHDLSRFPAIHMLYGYNLIPFPCSNWELFFAGLPYPSQVLPLSPCIMTKWKSHHKDNARFYAPICFIPLMTSAGS